MQRRGPAKTERASWRAAKPGKAAKAGKAGKTTRLERRANNAKAPLRGRLQGRALHSPLRFSRARSLVRAGDFFRERPVRCTLPSAEPQLRKPTRFNCSPLAARILGLHSRQLRPSFRPSFFSSFSFHPRPG